MDACIAREKSYQRKSYGNVRAAEVVQADSEKNPDRKWKTLQKNIKGIVSEEFQTTWINKIQTLLLQGNFLELMSVEQEDLTWRSVMYDLPYKVLSFAVRASIDRLPTFRNLQRWGKKVSAKCKLCGNKQTLQHVLNGCKVMLEQGRYTWRHNNILNLLYN